MKCTLGSLLWLPHSTFQCMLDIKSTRHTGARLAPLFFPGRHFVQWAILSPSVLATPRSLRGPACPCLVGPVRRWSWQPCGIPADSNASISKTSGSFCLSLDIFLGLPAAPAWWNLQRGWSWTPCGTPACRMLASGRPCRYLDAFVPTYSHMTVAAPAACDGIC